MALSPMMQQYNAIKEQYKDCLLLYRLGDFYELFWDDALIVSNELELTLTGRNCGLEERAPMCGVPFHSADGYIARLVENGHKVAVCEQVEDPKETKGLVKRDVVRILTPGTMDLASAVDNNSNSYIASIHKTHNKAAIAYADVTTGELTCTEFNISGRDDKLVNELIKLSPKEIIYDSSDFQHVEAELNSSHVPGYLNPIDSSYYKYSNAEKAILNQFDVASLIPLDLDGREDLILALGSLILYMTDMQKQDPAQFKTLEIKESEGHMQLDRATMRNLEILETLYDKKVQGSLLGVLDKTKTAMGGRLLRKFLKEPLIDHNEINRRLDAVEILIKNPVIRYDIIQALKKIYDFERLTARIASMRANGKDLIALRNTLGALPEIIEALNSLGMPETGARGERLLLAEVLDHIDSYESLYGVIDKAICEEPPYTVTEGGLIKEGYSEELDSLKDSIKDAKAWIAGLEQTERERTGIKTIKVGYNKVFGYYIDVSRARSDDVPDDYIRKQTLVNNERYITPELKEKESLVFNAEAKINSLEYELFKGVREAIEPYIKPLQSSSHMVALLDVLVAFAEVSQANGYVKPVVDDSHVIDIRNGRHPSVEQLMGSGIFVSNDTYLNSDSKSTLIITGPNMSGKSTYMRQTAIIVLMAQIGMFVPADSAVIGVCDRVFTRIGASDNLSSGQSTFFIEMSELANILRNATSRSLVLLDEIGRGTSTFDGLSIAWATVEYLSRLEPRIRTMFATHYHEITVLEDVYDSIENLSVAVTEDKSNVIFLHKIIRGSASKSYGIHVAKIAGIPREIRVSAQKKLRELESGSRQKPMSEQLSIFDNIYENYGEASAAIEPNEDIYQDLVNKIKSYDINSMTPINALLALQEIKNELDEIQGVIND